MFGRLIARLERKVYMLVDNRLKQYITSEFITRLVNDNIEKVVIWMSKEIKNFVNKKK